MVLLVSEHDTSFREVVRRHLNLDFVTRKDFDVVHPHLARYMSDDHMPVLKFNAEHGVRKRLYDFSVLLDSILFSHSFQIDFSLNTSSMNSNDERMSAFPFLTHIVCS